MTTQYAVLKGLPAGLVFTSAKLFSSVAPDTVITGNTFSFSNRTNANSQYVVSIVRSPTALPAGNYTLVCYISTDPKVEIAITFLGTDGETATETPLIVELDSGTAAQLDSIEQSIDDLAAVQLAAVEVDAGTISGFPETLTIGDSYSEDTGQIRINITDSTSGDPIDSLGTLEFADADVAFTAFRPNDSARIVGTCEYVREPSSGTLTASYVLVTLLTSETAKGKAEYTYEGRLKFVWQGPSSSNETDEEQKTYKTTPFKFIANP